MTFSKSAYLSALVALLPLLPASSATPVKRAASGNPFAGYQFYPIPQYSTEINTYAIPNLSGSLKAAAQEVANSVGTFFWMDTADKVPVMGKYLANIKALNDAGANPPYMGQFVVYDLPNRDCAALASNGEYSIANNGAANYKAYIDAIAKQVQAYPDVNIAFVVEPDSLANMVTNLNVQKCADAADTYKTSVAYALKTLNFGNVAMYMDAGHAGWLGWSANIQPAAQLFASVYQAAGKPAAVRGLATNVANYNAWSVATCPSYTQGNSNCDEKRYVDALGPLLEAEGFPAHFITDVGRNGVQPTSQQAWGDWCNVKGTGFGVRPTTNTGDAYEDAFVWVKPGGESDGTSDSSATRYDAHCGYSDALTPAPEAGQWFEAYFEQLLKNANPPLGTGNTGGGTTTKPTTTTATGKTTTTTGKTTTTPITTTTKGTTTTKPTTTTTGSGACATKYGQCGGQDWKGPTCCAAGSTCKSSGQYYSQCL